MPARLVSMPTAAASASLLPTGRGVSTGLTAMPESIPAASVLSVVRVLPSWPSSLFSTLKRSSHFSEKRFDKSLPKMGKPARS